MVYIIIINWYYGLYQGWPLRNTENKTKSLTGVGKVYSNIRSKVKYRDIVLYKTQGLPFMIFLWKASDSGKPICIWTDWWIGGTCYPQLKTFDKLILSSSWATAPEPSDQLSQVLSSERRNLTLSVCINDSHWRALIATRRGYNYVGLQLGSIFKCLFNVINKIAKITPPKWPDTRNKNVNKTSYKTRDRQRQEFHSQTSHIFIQQKEWSIVRSNKC